MTHRSVPDIIGGLAVLAAGLFFLSYSLYSYRLGTAHFTGPGFYPAAVGVVTVVVGVLILIAAFKRAEDWPNIAWRPALWVFASIVAFIVVMPWFGLVPAIFVTVGVAAVADPESRPLGTVVLATVIAAGTWLIFSVGLGMTIPSFRMPF